MTEKEIKRKLEDMGLRTADLAVAMHETFDTVSLRSAKIMIRELINGRRWYPVYAKWLVEKYGIVVDPPQWSRPVRERMKSNKIAA